jgi:hypothetical protein
MKHLPLLGLVLAACSGGAGGTDDPGEFELAADSVVGIYSLDSFLKNEAACTPDGMPVESLNGHGFAVAFKQQSFGLLLDVLSCASPQDCRDKAADRDGGFTIDFSFGLSRLGVDGELTGEERSTGFSQGNGTCTRGSVSDTVLTLTGDQLRIEQAITIADDYAADPEGFCSTDLARDAAEGNSCSQMELLTATFVEAL